MDNETSHLIQRYKDALKEGREPYFDIDELDDLLVDLEADEEYTSFAEFVKLGRKLHPDDIGLQIQEGRSAIFLEDYEKALTLINAIKGADEGELDILRAECYCRLGQFDKVLKHTKELIKEKCDYLEEFFETVAHILVELEMDDEALEFIKRGLKLFPNNYTLEEERYLLMEEFLEPDEAIKLYNKQLDEDPYNAEHWFTVGQLYADKGDFTKAIEALNFASACNDSNPDEDIEILRGHYLFLNGSYEKAIEVYKNVCTTLGRAEDDAEICSALAKCYIGLDDYEEAYKYLKKVVGGGRESDNPIDYINFIHCAMETEHEKEVPEVLDLVNKKFPQNIHILSTLASTYRNIGREKDSKDAADRLLKISDKSKHASEEEAHNLFSTGEFFYMIGDTDEALRFFNAVYKLKPDYPFIHIHLALVYLLKGDMRHFEEHYNENSIKDFRECMAERGFDADKLQQMMDEAAAETRRRHLSLPDELIDGFLQNEGSKN